jgi:hypothetical protein
MIRAVTIRKNKKSPEELVFSSAVHTEVIEKAQALRKDNYLVSLISLPAPYKKFFNVLMAEAKVTPKKTKTKKEAEVEETSE